MYIGQTQWHSAIVPAKLPEKLGIDGTESVDSNRGRLRGRLGGRTRRKRPGENDLQMVSFNGASVSESVSQKSGLSTRPHTFSPSEHPR